MHLTEKLDLRRPRNATSRFIHQRTCFTRGEETQAKRFMTAFFAGAKNLRQSKYSASNY